MAACFTHPLDLSLSTPRAADQADRTGQSKGAPPGDHGCCDMKAPD